MVNVGWMTDPGLPRAGAVLSVEAFQKAMPDGVILTYCHPDKRPPTDIDIFVLHGDLFDARWIEVMKGKPIMAHRHGGWYGGDPIFRRWILDNATLITFNSPKQYELFRYPINTYIDYIPLPIDVDLFQSIKHTDRSGTMFASLIVPAKGISYVMDWALRLQEPVDFYGMAPIADMVDTIVAPCRYMGSVSYEQMPYVLARYKNFVFMPHESDLYARVVVEAYASGCDLILNGDEKAFYGWFNLANCRQATKLFWDRVLQTLTNGG